MIIQAVKEEHKSILFQHHEICFREHIEQIFGWDDDWQINHFDDEWNNGEWRILLDDGDDNKIIGYLMWKVKEDHVYLCNISLLPEYQNRGFGAEAMAFIIQTADSHKLDVKLSTFRTNEQAIPFYERLGFNVIKQEETSKLLHRPFCSFG